MESFSVGGFRAPSCNACWPMVLGSNRDRARTSRWGRATGVNRSHHAAWTCNWVEQGHGQGGTCGQ